MTQTLAANWLNISINLLLVIHVIICLLLALVVLMQRPKQEGLGAAFGGGLTDQAFGAQTTNVLQKGTVYLGTLFFVVTLILAILIGKRQSTDESMTQSEKAAVEETAGPASESIEKKEDEDDAVTMPGEEETPAESGSEETPAPPAPAPAEGTPAPAETPSAPAEDKPENTEAPASGGTTGGDQ